MSTRGRQLVRLLDLIAILVILVLAVLWAEHVLGATYSARLVRIIDGDTIVVRTDAGIERIRIEKIDTPEMSGPVCERVFALQAREALAGVLPRELTIHARATDRYGRTLARIDLPDGRDLGEWLIEQGYARRYRAGNHKDPWC